MVSNTSIVALMLAIIHWKKYRCFHFWLIEVIEADLIIATFRLKVISIHGEFYVCCRDERYVGHIDKIISRLSSIFLTK